jgi:ABC-2 type transport system permease protein
MSTTQVIGDHAAASAAAPVKNRPSTVVARLTARRALRSGALWGYVFGAVVASSALSYSSIYKTKAERDHLAASFGLNHAASALFGPAPELQTVAGFTAFKVSMTLIVIGAVWGLLTSTRLLRGEEDAGRWELLVTGATTRGAAAGQAIAGLTAGPVALWLVTALLTSVAGASTKVGIGVGQAMYLALALVASPVMFLALGALTSQLAPTRRQAAAQAAVVLGVSYALRLVADAGVGAHWLVWLSPLGWVEELRPLTAPGPAALLPIAALASACGGLAVVLARGRDVGASILPNRATAAPRLRLLSRPAGLALRLVRPTALGWALAVAMTGLVMGIVAPAAGRSISGSSVQQVFSRLGARGSGPGTFLGVSFLIVAMIVGFAGAGQVSAARREEAEGRLSNLLAQPVPRWSWLAGRLSVAVALIVVCGLLAGLFAWAGTAAQGPTAGLAATIGAGLNVVPSAMALLGLGAAALGIWPRRAPQIVQAALVWSVLIELVGGFALRSHWLLDTSVFHQMAAAPAVAPDWGRNAWMVVFGLVGAAVGLAAFNRRDVVEE